MIGIETVKGLQVMRIDLSAVFATNISLLLLLLLLLLELLAIERIVAAYSMELMWLLLMIERVKVLQMCHIVAQMLIMRIGVMLLLFGTIFHWQWRRLLLLLLCIGRSSVRVAVAAIRFETIAATVQR